MNPESWIKNFRGSYYSEAFGTGNALLRYGIDTRCAEQAFMVRDAFSEAFGVKNRLFRYGRDIRCKKQAPGVPNEISDARFLHYNQQFRENGTPFAFSRLVSAEC